MEFLVVFVGAGLGGACRHGVGIAALKLFGSAFPVGTLTVNVLGSLLMGALVALFALKIETSQATRLFLTTGFLGGFTTFSTFSLDAVTLFERGRIGLSMVYVLANVIGGFAALALALILLRRLG
ncbi:fluoride efflux transporter CrcB [Stakelama saccharophila]|uniref:Fluoride-specific ion channel FluC n=1 Tax=Stakelama saccharophila TaxID=3075605 RepID=A0ABZ0BAG1_9SPHN|nr:fluoride efflux transporter CrcB [Stakelama sp. W311]WNO54070.1 fluoride efflux transporter CrcB [Stakelama sp. W311]